MTPEPTHSEPATVPATTRRDVFLFSHPRTASNLLCRILSNQPNWTQPDNSFLYAYTKTMVAFGSDKSMQVDDGKRLEIQAAQHQALHIAQQARVDAAAECKTVLWKSPTVFLWEPIGLHHHVGASFPSPSPDPIHANRDLDSSPSQIFDNPTYLPDDFLLSWQPLFLIRHPALVFESWYRTELRVNPVELNSPRCHFLTSFKCSRELYDWYVSKVFQSSARGFGVACDVTPPKPLVIDADDVVQQTSLEKLCGQLKMDPSSLVLEWKETNAGEAQIPRLKVFMGSLWQSTSIDPTKASSGVDIGTRHEQWKTEFGVEAADFLLRRVTEAMKDYNYLRSRKI